jgi:hypothetical protein
MVSLISKFDLGGKQISIRSDTHEGQSRSAPKINQLSGSPYATFTTSLELI